MPFYQDDQTQALVFFKDEPDLPGNWQRLFDPDGYHAVAWRSLDALWRRIFAAKTALLGNMVTVEDPAIAATKKGK